QRITTVENVFAGQWNIPPAVFGECERLYLVRGVSEPAEADGGFIRGDRLDDQVACIRQQLATLAVCVGVFTESGVPFVAAAQYALLKKIIQAAADLIPVQVNRPLRPLVRQAQLAPSGNCGRRAAFAIDTEDGVGLLQRQL